MEKKIEKAVWSAETKDFEPRDWVLLALAALDQAGVTPHLFADACKWSRGSESGVLEMLGFPCDAKKRVMVRMLDPQGLPRAYGIADNRDDAQRQAGKELALYRVEKRLVGDPLADAEYTVDIREIES